MDFVYDNIFIVLCRYYWLRGRKKKSFHRDLQWHSQGEFKGFKSTLFTLFIYYSYTIIVFFYLKKLKNRFFSSYNNISIRLVLLCFHGENVRSTWSYETCLASFHALSVGSRTCREIRRGNIFFYFCISSFIWYETKTCANYQRFEGEKITRVTWPRRKKWRGS